MAESTNRHPLHESRPIDSSIGDLTEDCPGITTPHFRLMCHPSPGTGDALPRLHDHLPNDEVHLIGDARLRQSLQFVRELIQFILGVAL